LGRNRIIKSKEAKGRKDKRKRLQQIRSRRNESQSKDEIEQRGVNKKIRVGC
jgi:hypothetical protein